MAPLSSSSPASAKPETDDRASTLQAQIHENELQILEAYQKNLIKANEEYEERLAALKKSTNGKIVQQLKRNPILVAYAFDNMAEYDVRAPRGFADNRAISGLIQGSLSVVDMGLEELYAKGKDLLVADYRGQEEYQKFKDAKKKYEEGCQRRKKAMDELQDRDLSLQLELKMVLADKTQDKGPHEAGSKSEASAKASHRYRHPQTSTNNSHQESPSAALMNTRKDDAAIIATTEKHIIHLLRSQLAYIFSEWEMLAHPAALYPFTSTSINTCNHSLLPDLIKRRFDIFSLPANSSSAQHKAMIRELTDGVRHILQAFEHLFAHAVAGLPPYILAKRPIIKEMSLLEFQGFELQVASAKAKILRYERYGADTGPEERKTEDEQAKETLIGEMVKLEARKAELGRALGTGCGKEGCGCRAPETKEKHREPVVEKLEGKEAWKDRRAGFEEFVRKFVEWERKGGKGGMEAFVKKVHA